MLVSSHSCAARLSQSAAGGFAFSSPSRKHAPRSRQFSRRWQSAVPQGPIAKNSPTKLRSTRAEHRCPRSATRSDSVGRAPHNAAIANLALLISVAAQQYHPESRRMRSRGRFLSEPMGALRIENLLVGCLLTATACSSDGGSSSPADAALSRRDCYLGLQVPGVRHTGFGCSGTETSSSVSGFKPNEFEVALSVSLTLAEPPALGDLALSRLTVSIPEGDAMRRWEAPVESCSAVATDSAVDSDFGWVYFRIDISCVEPAQPEDAAEDPLDLGNFTIVTFFSE